MGSFRMSGLFLVRSRAMRKRKTYSVPLRVGEILVNLAVSKGNLALVNAEPEGENQGIVDRRMARQVFVAGPGRGGKHVSCNGYEEPHMGRELPLT